MEQLQSYVYQWFAGCATSHFWTRRAKTGLTWPVPAPITTNIGHSPNGEDGSSRNDDGVAGKKCHTQWSSILDVDLARCNDAISLRDELAHLPGGLTEPQFG